METKNSIVVGLDFDGTCVTHEYPNIGKDIGAAAVLKQLVEHGHKLMLWTMRGTKPQGDRETLKEAVDWFNENDIRLWGINMNPSQQASGWSNSHKQHAHMYIDDAALGAPLTFNPELSDRPFMDWVAVEQILKQSKII